tara:strand:+ start:773 stop:1003 length:231 start_codon:yes stop_codon:yes gene_type:complete
MKFELILKTDNEVVDTIDFTEGPTPTANIKGAKAYFMARKMLEEKDFDNLFKVRPKPYVVREYEWWKEESTDLDDF